MVLGVKGVKGNRPHLALANETEGEALRTKGQKDMLKADLYQGFCQPAFTLADGRGKDPAPHEVSEDAANQRFWFSLKAEAEHISFGCFATSLKTCRAKFVQPRVLVLTVGTITSLTA